MVELCNSRMNILQYDEETLLKEAKEIDLRKIRTLISQVVTSQTFQDSHIMQENPHYEDVFPYTLLLKKAELSHLEIKRSAGLH